MATTNNDGRMVTDKDGYSLVVETDSSDTPDLLRVYVTNEDGDYMAVDITVEQALSFSRALAYAARITEGS